MCFQLCLNQLLIRLELDPMSAIINEALLKQTLINSGPKEHRQFVDTHESVELWVEYHVDLFDLVLG